MMKRPFTFSTEWSLFGDKKEYDKYECNFKICNTEISNYEDTEDFIEVSRDNIFKEVIGEDDRDGIYQQLANYMDWYFNDETDLDARLKRLSSELEHTLHNCKTIIKNLNNSKTKCDPYNVKIEKDIKGFGKYTFDENILKEIDTYKDSKDFNRIKTEIHKAIDKFLLELNKVADIIFKKLKKKD